MVRARLVVTRMHKNLVQPGVRAFVVQQNQTDGGTRIRIRLDLSIEPLHITAVKNKFASIDFPWKIVRGSIEADHLPKIEIERGVLHPERDRVVHLLHLQTLFAFDLRIRITIF